MHQFGSYEDRVKSFDWKISEKELEYEPGKVINIGWYCSDRICQQGKANKTALLWEGQGVAGRQYSYNDIRLAIIIQMADGKALRVGANRNVQPGIKCD